MHLGTGIFATAQAAPDEAQLGQSRGYPLGTAATYFYDEAVRVGSFSRLSEIDLRPNTWATLKPAPVARQLALSPSPQAADFAKDLRWRLDGKTYTLDDYLTRQRIMGLMVIKQGQVLFERYQYERTVQMRFLSNSMAKSLASLAFGYALQEGRIHSLDARVDVLDPAFKGTLYGQASLRDLLRMASGARFVEDYSGQDDAARFSRTSSQRGVAVAAREITARQAPDGQRFHYTSSQTAVLSQVFQTVVGQDVAAYLEPRLWQPLGAASEALWLKDRFGVVRAGSNFTATLQDYARLGVVLANDGVRPDTGAEVVPKAYLLEATDARQQPAAFAPRSATPYFGYGYQFWIYPGDKRRFALLGVYGQIMAIDPEQQLVLVQVAANATASASKTSLAREQDALWRAIVAHFGRWNH